MFYLGVYNPDTKMFRKAIDPTVWNILKTHTTHQSTQKTLRYYLVDRCIIKDQDTGLITMEAYPRQTLKSVGGSHSKYQILEIMVDSQKIIAFPTQLEYMNKQIYETDCQLFNGGTVLFSSYNEKGTDYLEIASASETLLGQLLALASVS